MPNNTPLGKKRLKEEASLLEETTSALLGPGAHGLALLLHDLADLDGRVEELGGAAVEADGLALIELGLAVVCGDALLLARVLKAVFWRPSPVSACSRVNG